MIMAAGLKKELILDNLDCANCAARIEKAVQDIDGVTDAVVDFTTRKLSFEITHPARQAPIMRAVTAAALQIESGLEISEPAAARPKPEPDNLIKLIAPAKMIRLGLGLGLFVLGLAFQFAEWVELAVFLASYVLIGGDVLLRAVRNIIRGQVFDESFLMSIATLGAFAIREFPEAVAVMLFYEVGELFEKLAVGRSRRSISALLDIRPDYANLQSGDTIRQVSPEAVQIGDRIVIKPGEKVPLDGLIVEGTSLLDLSSLTGESVPRYVKPGDAVYSGSINKNGLFFVEVTRAYQDSTVAKILDLVQHASSKKAPTEKFITSFARYYTPAVVIIALALAVIPPLAWPGAAFADWLYRALIFLVVSCPCALVISIPLGYFGGIGGASRHGILIKGSNYLEALKNVDTIVFDKTGTLTRGVFKVTRIHSRLATDQDLLELAAYAESYSNHPIAQSILLAYGREIRKERISSYDEIPGHGIQAVIDGRTVLAGSSRFLQSSGVTVDDPVAAAADSVESGTIVHFAIDQHDAGYIVIADEIKADAARAISELKALGIRKTVMLTGDSRLAGEQIAAQLGLDEVYSELLPDQKVQQFEQLEKAKTTRGKLLFVGDGINDSPVLARSDVGIAMGGLGSDAAIEAADVVIMTDQPSKVGEAIRLARKTSRIVRQNITLALVVKVSVLLMGAGGIASMWEAVFADMGVALIAIFNAMRILNGPKNGQKNESKNKSKNESKNGPA